MKYQYITEDNLEIRQTYMYAMYGGKEFLTAYLNSRQTFLRNVYVNENGIHMYLEKMLKKYENVSRKKTIVSLLALAYAENVTDAEYKKQIDRYIKRFEVHKLLFEEYDAETGKPLQGSEHRFFDNYLMLAVAVEKSYVGTANLKYLSGLLKLNDTLLSLNNEMDQEQQSVLRFLVRKEVCHVKALADAKNISMEGE